MLPTKTKKPPKEVHSTTAKVMLWQCLVAANRIRTKQMHTHTQTDTTNTTTAAWLVNFSVTVRLVEGNHSISILNGLNQNSKVLFKYIQLKNLAISIGVFYEQQLDLWPQAFARIFSHLLFECLTDFLIFFYLNERAVPSRKTFKIKSIGFRVNRALCQAYGRCSFVAAFVIRNEFLRKFQRCFIIKLLVIIFRSIPGIDKYIKISYF